jgi:hypothetical protein
MGLGVLEDHKLGQVPGTVLLDQEAGHSEETTAGLKHGVGKNAHLILAPQPSQDPNDPLNWPEWQKNVIGCILMMCAVMCVGVQVYPFLNAYL